MYKLSHYTIFSDAVNITGDFVLFSTRTGQATVLSKSSRDKIEATNFSDLPEPIFEKLLADKAIVEVDEDELLTIVNENKDYVDSATELYEVIQPSAMCQLGCDYCGQDHK